MKDQYGRAITYMRISITDRCNLHCQYCMPGEPKQIPREEILSYEEICQTAEAAVNLGITHFRITGGEPLVRKDCFRLIRMLHQINGVERVSMTTNGVLLFSFMNELASAGLDDVNVSLDTLNRGEFLHLTGKDSLSSVLEGIEAAVESGIPVKLNAVNRRGMDWRSLVSYAESRKIPLRFIEMMPIGHGKNHMGSSNEELLKQIEEIYGPARPVENSSDPGNLIMEEQGRGPARYYRFQNLNTKIGFISAIHHRFCESCNRVRLSSTGYLKACLCYQQGADLRPILRDPAQSDDLVRVMREVIYRKPREHDFDHMKNITEKKSMNRIGG
ncbi:MAG: GTP 3',8-cyclase MoaA [Clostridiales bacterium]|nr:GTP 3',8-cyclase MoaA [Clostridiales bacterium]